MMKPWLKWTLISLPILVGGYFLYTKLRKPKTAPTQPTPPTPPTPQTSGDSGNVVTKSAPTPQAGGGSKYVAPQAPQFKEATFPLGLGSRGDLVFDLQNAIMGNGQPDIIKLLGTNPKQRVDGKFGTGTQAAVYKLLGKITVDSQKDIDKIKALNRISQLPPYAQSALLAFE